MQLQDVSLYVKYSKYGNYATMKNWTKHLQGLQALGDGIKSRREDFVRSEAG